jgi:hypothetical protein
MLLQISLPYERMGTASELDMSILVMNWLPQYYVWKRNLDPTKKKKRDVKKILNSVEIKFFRRAAADTHFDQKEIKKFWKCGN